MFGGEDDDDFAPSASSKLASLFGFGKSSDEGNTSLTYTAPKQPKKGRGESQISKSQESAQATSSPAKLSIIIVKAVHTYKLAEGNYNAQGKLGAAVLGNASTRVYQLLLYKGKQQHVTSCRITAQFQFVVQPNNYATFYDDQTQNWSIMFETSADAIDFAREVGLARGSAAAPGEHKLLTQDLLFGVGSGASEGDLVEVRYIVYPMSEGKLGSELENTTQADKPLRVKLKKDSWEEGLLGAAKGCKRMIMLSPALTGPWRSQVPHDTGVMVQVDIGRIKSSRVDSGESTDDTSIKARGASISEALTNSPKTHKASIISRMARMGQATLPLKGAIACNPSDSEETEEESSVVNKTPAKVRLTKSRPAAEKPVPNVMVPPAQHVAVYPLSVPWQQTQAPPPPQQHQFVRTNGSMTYVQPSYSLQTVSSPQMFPVTTPPAVSSPDSHLSVFLAETRTHNSELRMGVTKVADKVDQVLMKLDTMHHRRESTAGLMDPSSLLASVQKLVSENEILRSELEEKRSKIDQLYTMLHSNMMESRNDSLVLTLQQEKAQLSADLGEARSRTCSLEMLISNRGEELVHSKQLVRDQEEKLAALQQELESSKENISVLIKNHEELQNRAEREVTRHVEHIRNLELESTALKERIHNLQAEKTSTGTSNVNEVKKVMNVVYHQTAGHFSGDTTYNSSTVKQILMNTIRDVTLKYLEVQSKDGGSTVQRQDHKVPIQTKIEAVPKKIEQVVQEMQNETHKHDTVTPESEPNVPVSKSDDQPNKCEAVNAMNSEPETEKPEDCEIAHSLPEIEKEGPHIAAEDSDRLKVQNTSTSDQGEKKKEELQKDKQTRESSLEQSWRPQPPPPPLFDDDDDDDDWLT
ncbi:hypothetical protein L9F63_016576 [Diploptera punctata]|uniref:Uncharacterized protein n=1 Tax=Diploptera punctata TaxID=6984 RepID=A0AAD8A1H5_DIPPU|nr:hypothetical protein L9F63_016576 [Diploptera punctata]